MTRRRVTLTVDGAPLAAWSDQTVAAALIAAGRRSFGRHPKTGAPVGPVCMMGVCFGCACEIDGRPGAQACMEAARDGLVVRLREAAP